MAWFVCRLHFQGDIDMDIVQFNDLFPLTKRILACRIEAGQAFPKFDTQGTGFVDFHAFAEFARGNMSSRLGEDEMRAIFVGGDDKHTGAVDDFTFKELACVLQARHESLDAMQA